MYVHFYQTKGGLEYLKANINKISFVFPESPFNKVLWNNGKMEAKSVNQTFAYNLALYMLKQEIDQAELETKYREIIKNDKAVLPSKVS